VNQRVFIDDGDGVFDRAEDTDADLHAAGCMAFHDLPGHHHFHLDQVSLYRLISETSGAIVDTSTKVTFCVVDFAQFAAGLPGSPPDSYYDTCGLDVQGISVGWRDDYHWSVEGQEFDVTGVPEGDYCLRSRIDPNNRFLETDETNNQAEQRYHIDPTNDEAFPLSGPCSIPSGTPPANDSFDSPAPLDFATTDGSNIAATKQSGEPSHGGDDGGASVWYEWTPDSTLDVRIDTCGSSIDTLLGVYTGDNVDSLAPVANNDDAPSMCGPGTMQSGVTFTAQSGTTYRIAVDGYGGTTGVFALHLVGPELEITDVSRLEGDSGRKAFVFTVSLSIPSTQPVTVDFTTEDGRAKAPKDYGAVTGSLTFAPGEVSKQVRVRVNGDDAHEERERFSLLLTAPGGAALADELGTGTIRNDDPPAAPSRRTR
jgi:hypothetical protein